MKTKVMMNLAFVLLTGILAGGVWGACSKISKLPSVSTIPLSGSGDLQDQACASANNSLYTYYSSTSACCAVWATAAGCSCVTAAVVYQGNSYSCSRHTTVIGSPSPVDPTSNN